MNFLLAAAAAFELSLPIMCGDTSNLLEGLRNTYQEEIVFMSPSENSNGDLLTHSLWVNTEKQTWSFVVTNKEKDTLCVIASGQNYVLVEEESI